MKAVNGASIFREARSKQHLQREFVGAQGWEDEGERAERIPGSNPELNYAWTWNGILLWHEPSQSSYFRDKWSSTGAATRAEWCMQHWNIYIYIDSSIIPFSLFKIRDCLIKIQFGRSRVKILFLLPIVTFQCLYFTECSLVIKYMELASGHFQHISAYTKGSKSNLQKKRKKKIHVWIVEKSCN